MSKSILIKNGKAYINKDGKVLSIVKVYNVIITENMLHGVAGWDGMAFYSLDGGNTWNDFYNLSQLVITNVTQIKFKTVTKTNGYFGTVTSASALFPSIQENQETENIILTSDIRIDVSYGSVTGGTN